MKLKVVVIDFEPPAWLRKLTAIGAPVLGILVSGTVLATPKQWATGDALSAADLNALNVLTVNGVKYSVGPTHYCGIGPIQTTGAFSFNGKSSYAAAKAMCEASTGCSTSPTAHMCSGEEIGRSEALGDAVPNGWYFTYAAAAMFSTSIVRECLAWTESLSGESGAWLGANGSALEAPCDSMQNVLCCD
jgi:hypothetical protein